VMQRGGCRGFRDKGEDTKTVIIGGTGLIGSKLPRCCGRAATR
jgi:hypothetical protein